jgi:pimeloyl-ACP methyl ester carboxylesterase
LLGFDQVSSFSYFADRVVAALRASLEQALDGPVPVIAVPIPPTLSLAARQRALVRTLANRVHAIERGNGRVSVHLLGHSTGGLDANLLTAEQPRECGDWADIDPRAEELCSRIRSVTTIAAPHQGACIVRDPAARFLGLHNLSGVAPFAGLCARFVASVIRDIEVSEFLASSVREVGKARRFVAQVLPKWGLLEDLDPTRPRAAVALRKDVIRRSFVTLAGQPKSRGGSSPADALFHNLSARASGRRTGCVERGDLVQASVARLNAALEPATRDNLLIMAAATELRSPLDGGHNDGIVNAARQLIDPHDRSELAGIVVADHFDVVGYYDRHFYRADPDDEEREVTMRAGLLHSGSGFRDDEFFELYQRVAKTIASAVRS